MRRPTSIGNAARFAALGIALGLTTALADAACETCSLTLHHRSGPVAISASVAQPRTSYKRGDPIPIQIAITNRSKNPILVNPAAVVQGFSLHMIGPATKETTKDRMVPSGRTQVVPAGTTFRFPVTDLLAWHYEMKTPGVYQVNFSYDGVDSNAVTFRISS